MPLFRIEDVHIDRPGHRKRRTGTRLWREWCFVQVALQHFRVRFIVMSIILVVGASLFLLLEPEKGHTFPRAIFYTWSLIFGETPEAFPRSRILQAMFFIMPVLGLTVIIEGIIDFALMLRDRRRYERSWCLMLASSLKDHVIIVGFGRLGYRTFKILRAMGEPVVVLERDDQSEFLEELRVDGSPVLFGDARRDALLEEANVAEAKSIVLATDNDMTNLEAALDARRYNPKIRVVMRMFDQNVADKIGEGFQIDNAMSQSALSAPAFAAAAVQPWIVNSFVVNNQLVVMQRWLIRRNGPLTGKTVGVVARDLKVNVLEHRPAGGDPDLCPAPDTPLEAGDGVIVQGAFGVLDKLQREVLKLDA